MEIEGSGSKVAGTSTPPTAASPAPSAANGSTPGTPDTGSTLTQKEILRERYLKGVKKRECAVCGNTARARCPFRACKTCCMKAKNVCEVHVNKPKHAANTPVIEPHDPRWAAAVNAMPYGAAYVRPPYMPAAYHAAQAGMAPYRVGFVTPQSGACPPGHSYMAQNARPYVASPATLEQQELQKLKNLKLAIQAASREAQNTNAWRTQKMREFNDGELAAEDEAFDRYMLNMALLEEIFLPKTGVPTGLSADGELLVGESESMADIDEKGISDTLMVVDGLRGRREMDAARKQASRARLKKSVERGLQVLKGAQHEVEEFAEEDDLMHGAPLGHRRELKRFKAHTKEGKDCLKRIDLFETLLQKTSQIHSKADINSCGEMCRQSFGRGLDVLLPHLSGNVENLLDARVHDATAAATPPEPRADGDEALPEPSAAEEVAAKPSPEQESNHRSSHGKSSATAIGAAGGASPAGDAGGGSKGEAAVADWPRLHDGFLAGRGWWKVEVDEHSAQLVCQHLLNSKQGVQVL